MGGHPTAAWQVCGDHELRLHRAIRRSVSQWGVATRGGEGREEGGGMNERAQYEGVGWWLGTHGAWTRERGAWLADRWTHTCPVPRGRVQNNQGRQKSAGAC